MAKDPLRLTSGGDGMGQGEGGGSGMVDGLEGGWIEPGKRVGLVTANHNHLARPDLP